MTKTKNLNKEVTDWAMPEVINQLYSHHEQIKFLGEQHRVVRRQIIFILLGLFLVLILLCLH